MQKKNNRYVHLLTLVFFTFLQLSFGQETPMSFENNKETKLKGNATHTYEVLLKKGELLQLHLQQKNVDIQILALSPDKDSLQNFDLINGKKGEEIIELPIKKNGIYSFKVKPFISKRYTDSARANFIKKIDGSYKVNKFKVLSILEHKKIATFRKAQKESVISWIKDKSITLKSVKAETGLTDLAYLKPILKDVQIVGLGETSHGTKEIFQMKHRMLEFLVKEMGFKIFAIEASHVGCRPINEYILHGKGTSRTALSAQEFWIWNTEEVIDMIEWMRKYNTSVNDDEKIKFVGIDTQIVALDLAYKNVSGFIKKTNFNELHDIQVDSVFQGLKTNRDRTDISLQRQQLYTLLSYLIVNETRLVRNTSNQEYAKTIRDLKKIIQGVESNDRKFQKKVDFDIRDEYMAQTTLEVLHKEKLGSKMVLWAHNGHISKNSGAYINGYLKSLGSVLKRDLGDAYYAVGFSTYQGSFQARNYSPKEKKYAGAVSFKISPAEVESLDWYFNQSKKDIFFLNFNPYPNSNAVQTFLNTKHKTNSAGANWTFEYSYSPTRRVEPGKSYDGMIFIKETSAATLTPGGQKEIEKRLRENR
ncbi:erythromycin esterase family protein [Aquimarina sp. AD10]|uniref:erythromycin esterase family protein n=1 Tax=Aquimarina sp. AD10 TaxID=1714849 RepID=UPI000E46C808|nr:erythromycin esterase family protein [Aquimarina sp. AD10]AXT61893.1 erythromycin esterase family protein [Aquimarina sp. AD10]RKN02353.1 erythromycin esterase family protein [Aquimarina sp. AD10]